jgi:hypothetical protein
MIIKSYERRFVASIHARSFKGACYTLDFVDFISIPKKMIVLISLNRYGMDRSWPRKAMVGVGLGKKGGKGIEHEKRILLAFQIIIELVVFWGIHNEDVMARTVAGSQDD